MLNRGVIRYEGSMGWMPCSGRERRAGSPIGDVVLQEGVLLGSIDKFFIAEGATRYTIYPGYLPIYLAWVESR